MSLDAVVLVGLAGLFAVVSGVNDGGALLATGLKLPTVRPVRGMLALVLLVAVVPLITHQVAVTFVTRLGSYHQPGGRIAMTIAVISALVVVGVLSAKGRPTSLTLAIVGGLAGAGTGWGLPVSPGSVALVLAFGLAAPLAGGLLAWVLVRVLVAVTTARGLSGWHRAGFLLQGFAYAANDGQKMLAVFMIAFGVPDAMPAYTSAAAVLFGLGTLYGLPRAGRTLGRELIASRPQHGVAAELSASVAAIACASVGMPVSMTQAIAGGLIGAGVAQSTGRVRWYATGRIVLAWLLTLPAGALLGWALALLVKGLVGMGPV
ncbi:inorganic phosphate transporter [Nonomuraea sp. B12E4]|uniref:inorganic phosphate transporter n=1 Tax=Nonomuraea sp. B12E4 TaxID=3153564 RepID=UPI00325EA4B4